MPEVLRQLFADRLARTALIAVTVFYLFVYLLALGDLSFDGAVRPFDAWLVPMAGELWTRARVPFQFEAIAVVELPFTTWLISPLNTLIGSALGTLAGLQLALTRVAWLCARSCGLRPTTGLLAALPGLLAAQACCVPALFILFGIQLTATLIGLMSVMIPIAFVLLAASVAFTWHYAQRRCSEAFA